MSLCTELPRFQFHSIRSMTILRAPNTPSILVRTLGYPYQARVQKGGGGKGHGPKANFQLFHLYFATLLCYFLSWAPL